MILAFAALATTVVAAVPPVGGPLTVAIFFDEGSLMVRPVERQVMVYVIRTLRRQPRATVIAEGYAAVRGSALNDRPVACARARAARDYLIAHGIPASRLAIRAPHAVSPAGEREPGPDPVAFGWRVELTFTDRRTLIEARSGPNHC